MVFPALYRRVTPKQAACWVKQSAADVVRSYKQLQEVERSFKESKDFFRIMPRYLIQKSAPTRPHRQEVAVG